MTQLPPPAEKMTDKKVKQRLTRIFTPRADGSFIVPDDLLKEYTNPMTRRNVEELFEKCGFQRDWLFLETRLSVSPLRASKR